MARKSNKKNNKLVKILTVLIPLIIIFVSGVIEMNKKGEPDSPVVGETAVEDEFAVHFIDVGQGDCILIQSGDKNMLIDAGENGNEQQVLDYLDECAVDEFEYIVATHPHSDHIGGLAEVIEDSKVLNIIMPRLTKDNTPTTVTYEKLLTAAKGSGARVISAVPGNIYSLGDAEFQILSPFEQDDNLNNMSVAVRLTYQGRSFLFTGDAEKAVEKQLLKSDYDLSADVFKLGHHGSSTSNTADFFEAVNPDYVVICCGEDNKYGHPHREVMDLIYDMDPACYRTDEDGSIIFTVSNNMIEVFTEK